MFAIAEATLAALGVPAVTGMFGLILYFLNKERTENALQHAASQNELKNVVVGLARVEGAVQAHIASPHIANPHSHTEATHGAHF